MASPRSFAKDSVTSYSHDELADKKVLANVGSCASELPVPPVSPAASFRILGRVAQALRRFKSALNPTYTYGRPELQAVAFKPAAIAALQGRAQTGRASGSGRATSGRTASGRPTVPGINHGFKASILLKPLPEPTPVSASA